MSRESSDELINGELINGFDYDMQCWVEEGIILRCGHLGDSCKCIGRVMEGESHAATKRNWERNAG